MFPRPAICCIFVAVLFVFACAPELPPPPAHPALEGDWPAVSRGDIETALALVRDLYVGNGSSPPAIYRVVVNDRNHINLCRYLSARIETCEVVERVKGKWQLAEYRMIKGPGI